MVLNREDPEVMAMLPPPVRRQAPEAASSANTSPLVPTCRSAPAISGIEVVNGMPWLVRAHEADETRKRSRSRGGGSCTSSA